jgi:hypothetical protein
VHHTEPRSEGGTHDPNKLAPLCEAHHRALHDGRLFLGGTWSAGFRFNHADGTSYGGREVPDPRVSERATGAFSVLRNLGFREGDARAAVDSIREQLTPEMPLEEVARLAIRATAELPSMRHKFRTAEALAEYVPSWAA